MQARDDWQPHFAADEPQVHIPTLEPATTMHDPGERYVSLSLQEEALHLPKTSQNLPESRITRSSLASYASLKSPRGAPLQMAPRTIDQLQQSHEGPQVYRKSNAPDPARLDLHDGYSRRFPLSTFPFAFAVWSLLIFLVPIWMTVHISFDRDTEYWVGTMCQYVVFLPLVFIVALLSHIRAGRLHRTTVALSIIIPCIVILICGDVVLTRTHEIADTLTTPDCSATESKQQLEQSWGLAYRFFMRCIVQTVQRDFGNNATIDAAAASSTSLFRISDCEEYSKLLEENRRDWLYLQRLEQEEQCGGWCTFSRPLWTFDGVVDSCSIAVGESMKQKVSRTAKQAIILAAVALGSASACLAMIQTAMNKMANQMGWK